MVVICFTFWTGEVYIWLAGMNGWLAEVDILGGGRSSASMSGIDGVGLMGLIGLIICLKTSILRAIWNVLIILGGE